MPEPMVHPDAHLTISRRVEGTEDVHELVQTGYQSEHDRAGAQGVFSIGLIADTHVPTDAKAIPGEVEGAFRGVDLILHAGDIHASQALDWLETIAPVLAARGNGDWRVDSDTRVKESHVVVAGGFRVGVSHGLSLPPCPPARPLSKIMLADFGGPVDIFAFGDTHVAEIEVCEGTLMFNPGSPTLPHNLLPRLGTVGRLDISCGTARAYVILLGGEAGGIRVPNGVALSLHDLRDTAKVAPTRQAESEAHQ